MSADLISALASIGANQVQGVGTMGNVLPAPVPAAIGKGATSQFSELVSHGLNGVNTELLASQTDLQQLAVGNAQNLHQIMARLEESRLSFQLLMQVRGRLLEAYQDVMKMQV